MPVRFIHTNDTHGRLTQERADRLRPLREETDLYFDSGDCIKAGNLGIPIRQEPVWDVLAELRCTGSVIGNRETHPLESAFHAKIKGHRHPLLCSNLRKKGGSYPLLRSLRLDVGEVTVGIFAVMVPMVTERMKTQAASAYLWDQPISVAREMVEVLRPEVDLLVALTHIGIKEDLRLAERCPEIDVILGGHSHTVIEEPTRVGDTFVCQGGSHCRYVGVYEWHGRGELTGGLRPFP